MKFAAGRNFFTHLVTITYVNKLAAPELLLSLTNSTERAKDYFVFPQIAFSIFGQGIITVWNLVCQATGPDNYFFIKYVLIFKTVEIKGVLEEHLLGHSFANSKC